MAWKDEWKKLAATTDGFGVLLPFGAAVVGLAAILSTGDGEMREWLGTSWTFAKQILP